MWSRSHKFLLSILETMAMPEVFLLYCSVSAHYCLHHNEINWLPYHCNSVNNLHLQRVIVLPGIKASSTMLFNLESLFCAQGNPLPLISKYFECLGDILLKKRHSRCLSWCLLLLFIDCYMKNLNIACVWQLAHCT